MAVRTAWMLCAMLSGSLAAVAAPQVDVRLDGPADNRVCLACHGQSGSKPGEQQPGAAHAIDVQGYRHSVHAVRACTDCHEDVKTIPHGLVSEVRCGRCHPAQGPQPGGQPGAHPRSESVHDRALRQGKKGAPVCKDCHGTHDITGPAVPTSRVNRANVPTTCGRCHLEEYSTYRASIHGEAVAAGHKDAAVCIDCHGEHSGLLPKDDPESRINPLRVPDTCSKCHESAKLIKRYGLPPARYSTYRDSYHGIAAKYGDISAANCASCHGFHDILPSSNPKSRVNRANLAATCGQCHRGASANFARGTIHLMPSPTKDAPVYWVRLFYRLFIFALMAQFVGLIALDLLARRREARRGGRQ